MKKATKAPAKRSAPKKRERAALVILLLDESGSMGTVWNDVIGGTNAYVDGLAKAAPRASLSLIKFQTHVSPPRVYEPASSMPALTTESYVPGGMTALFDGVREAVGVGDDWLEKNKGGRVVVTIYTDGEENASKATKREQVVELVTSRTAAGWEFIYLGAVADAWSQGQQLGLASVSTFSYDAAKTQPMMAAAGAAMGRSMSSGQSVTMSYRIDPALAQAGVKKAKKNK